MLAARVVVPSFLAPLALGVVVRWLAPEASERIADRVLAVVGVIFTLCALALLVINFGLLVQAGWIALATLAGLSLFALVTGHVLGGPDPGDRTALAVCCATRHVGLAVLLAAAARAADRSPRRGIHRGLGRGLPHVWWRRA